MDNYRVVGDSREVGAIGIFEGFIENVVAEDSHEAYNQVREGQYSNNREHVQIKEIRLIMDCHANHSCSIIVEPRAYL